MILQNMKLVSSTAPIVSTSSSVLMSSNPRGAAQPKLSLIVHGTTDIVNEIIWVINMTLKDSPDTEIDYDLKALQRMAPNDLKNFGMSRKKLAYTKKAIGDWFWETVVLKDLKNSFFSLMFDDTTNIQHKKELQLVLKYWSLKLQCVNFVHLRTAFLTSGKAVPAVEEMKTAIKTNSLSTQNLVQLGSDGPNVTKSIKNKINMWLKEEEGLQDLFDLGSCHDHNLHNALKAGCEEMKNVHVLCQQISDYFKSSLNWEEFSNRTGANLKFITFFSVRWTTLGPATARIIELWEQLKAFFDEVAQKQESKQNKNEVKIISLLRSKTMEAEILFIHYVASLVEPVLIFLERQDQIIFQADDRYTEMLEKLVAIVLMPGHDAFKEVIREKAFKEHHENSIKMTLSEKIQQSIPLAEVKDFNKRVFNFLEKFVKYLSRKNFFHTFLFDVKFLSPQYIFEGGSIEKILGTVDYFKHHNQVIDKTKLFEELTLFVSPRNQELYKEITNIDKFYVTVDEKGKSSELVKLFRLVSALTISNAEVERNFSRSKLVITKQMSNLQEENFNARKHIISGMKFFQDDIATFPVSTSLISKVHYAHRDYKRKRDEDKTEQENAGKRQRFDEELSTQMRAMKEAANLHDNQIESAVNEAGKIKKDLVNEKKTLDNLLSCMATCKNHDQIQALIQETKLSSDTISALEDNYIKIQDDILKMQNDRIKKLARKDL